jgi:hypothetical protein
MELAEASLSNSYWVFRLSLAKLPYIIGIFVTMTGTIKNTQFSLHKKHIVLDMTDCYTCSFTEFLPFCNKLYYFANFKDFSTLSQA